MNAGARESTVWYLKRSRLFEAVDERVLEGCDDLFDVVEYPARTRLFDQGDRANAIYFLKVGRVRLGRITEEGKEITVAVLGPGDVFGEERLFGDDVRATIATCIEPSLVCTSHADDLFPLLARHPVLVMNVAKYLREQRDEAVATMEEMAFLKVPERIVKLFERLALEHGAPDPEGTRIELRLTHAEIASLVGSTRETVTLELQRLQRAGTIVVRDRAFIVPKR